MIPQDRRYWPARSRSGLWHGGAIASLLSMVILAGACRPNFWTRPAGGSPGVDAPSPMPEGATPKPLPDKVKEQLRESVRPLMEPATELKLVTSLETRPSSITGTYFGGLPYAEKGDIWPVCAKCEKPLSFICQLNMQLRKDDNPPTQGLYTVFYCWNCFPWDSNSESRGQWLVKYHPQPEEKAAVKLKDKSDPASRTKSCTVTPHLVDSLPDWDGLASQFPKVAKTWSVTAAPEPSDAYDEIRTELTKREGAGTQIGGYPAWIQSDDTPKCGKCNKREALLVQIDSEEAAGLMWGDAGSLYLFVCADHLAEVGMVMQCY